MTEDLELHVGIGGEKAFAASIAQMNAAVLKLSASVDKMAGGMNPAAKGIDKVGESAKSSGGMLSSFGGIASALAVGAVGMLANKSLDLAKAYETTSLQLEVFTGSAEAAKATLDQFNKIADATPFENFEVEGVGKKLLAFGIGLDEVESKILEVGNASAQSGKPLQELGVLYGKAKVAGTLFAEDINQFIEAGVPIIEALAVQMGTTADKVKKLGSEGKITFPVFEAAFSSLYGTGGKFGGMMDKLAGSSEGLMSTMRGDFNKAMREAGQQILPLVVDAMKKLLPLAKAAVGVFGDVAKAALEMGLFLGDNSALLVVGAGALLAYNSAAISAAISTTALSVVTAAKSLYTAAATTAQWLYLISIEATTGAMTLAQAAAMAFNVTIAANPVGAVIVGVTALASAYMLLSGRTETLTKEQAYHADLSKQVADGYGKESAGAAILFDKLEKLNPKSAEAKEVRDEINKTYKTYLPNQLTEASNNDEISKSQDAVNAGLLKNIQLKVRDAELTKAYTIQQTALIEANNALGKSTGASSAAIQKAVTSVQGALAKVGEESRLSVLQASGDFNSLARELGRVAGVGPDVTKTIADIAAAGLGLEFLDAAGAVSLTEDQIRSLMAFLDETTEKAGKAADGVKGIGGAAVVGSIDYLTGQLKKLNDQFNATGSEKVRLSLAPQIAELEKAIDRAKNLSDIIKSVSDGLKAPKATDLTDSELNDYLGTTTDLTKEATRHAEHLEQVFDSIGPTGTASLTELGNAAMSLSDRLKKALGDDAFSALKSGLADLKGAFMDFGVSAAQSIGYAIGAGKSLKDAFRESLNQLLVEVPRLAGMALLNAAATTPSPASLPLAAAGLALLGLSGILKGVQDKNKEAREKALADIPTSASGGAAPSGVGGFAALTGASQEQPIVINLSAEMDSVALGSLFERIRTDHNKATIKVP